MFSVMEEIASIEAIKMHLILSDCMYRKGRMRVKCDLLVHSHGEVTRMEYRGVPNLNTRRMKTVELSARIELEGYTPKKSSRSVFLET